MELKLKILRIVGYHDALLQRARNESVLEYGQLFIVFVDDMFDNFKNSHMEPQKQGCVCIMMYILDLPFTQKHLQTTGL